MSFQAVSIKTGTVGASPISIASTAQFIFATSELAGAQKAIISPTSNGVRISSVSTAPSTSMGIFVSSGTNYEVVGAVNVANLWLTRATTGGDASVSIEIQK